MSVLDTLGGVATFLVAALFLVVQTWVIAAALRRVLGVQVGWPRTFVVSAATTIALMSVVQLLFTDRRLPTQGSTLPVTFAYVALVVLWSFAIASAILVGLEAIVPTGSLPPLRRVLFGWGHRWRRGRRYAQILAIASKRGLGSQMRGVFSPRRANDRTTAQSLRLALDEAGVTFIKLGQMLSTRADLLPPVYIEELSALQNKAAPEPWPSLRTELEHSLGRPLSEVFASIDENPLASASVAQVHAATLLDGSQVVVKIQRPGAQAQMALDVDILRRLADMWDRTSPQARALGITDLVAGFGNSLAEELDYRVELENMRALRASLDRRGVRIPVVHEALSSASVIVMERFDATPVGDAAVLLAALPEETRTATAALLLEAVLGQIIDDGIFHADLHPGNVVIWPDGSPGLLDFGSVGRLDSATRRTLALLLWAIDADDPVLATDCLIALLDRPEGLDDRGLQRAIGILLTRIRGGGGSGAGGPAAGGPGAGGPGAGGLTVFAELFELVLANGFTVPPQIAAAMRSLGALEGTLMAIDPGLDLVAAARSVGKSTLAGGGPERVKDEFLHRAVSLLPIIDALPRQIGLISEQLERGRFTVHARVLSHPEDRAFLSGLVQQLVVAVLAGSAVLGGIWLFTTPGGAVMMPGISWFSFLGALLVFAGFMLALRAVAMVLGRSPTS